MDHSLTLLFKSLTVAMVEYIDSSQFNKWLFKTKDEISICRSKANYKARVFIGEQLKKSEQLDDLLSATECFACGFSQRIGKGEEEKTNYAAKEPLTLEVDENKSFPFLTAQEELVLVNFYVSNLPNLIGPGAQVSRLRREPKVTATAALLLRRFFLSNSVMTFDPKAIMTAAAFLGSKVEDATADVRHLEEGTTLMNAPVKGLDEIIPAELALLAGTNFELVCFHPYKAVVALTEDLRTFIKTATGRQLCVSATGNAGFPADNCRPPDLKGVYDEARRILDEVAILSDTPLLFSPGQVGLAALIVAQERLQKQLKNPNTATVLDLWRYVELRFPNEDSFSKQQQQLEEVVQTLTHSVEDSKTPTDMAALKSIHKKLKKVRLWGKKSSSSKKDKSTPPAKRQKTE